MKKTHDNELQFAYDAGWDNQPQSVMDCHCTRCQKRYHEGRLAGNLARESVIRRQERAR